MLWAPTRAATGGTLFAPGAQRAKCYMLATMDGFRNDLQRYARVLLHLSQFCSLQGQARYQPYGPGPHVPESWRAQEEAFADEEESDHSVRCQVSARRPGDISECGTCHLNVCTCCMPLHSCTLYV